MSANWIMGELEKAERDKKARNFYVAGIASAVNGVVMGIDADGERLSLSNGKEIKIEAIVMVED